MRNKRANVKIQLQFIFHFTQACLAYFKLVGCRVSAWCPSLLPSIYTYLCLLPAYGYPCGKDVSVLVIYHLSC